MNLRQRVSEFLFRGDSDAWLSFLRIGLGVQVLVYCLLLHDEWAALHSAGAAGAIDRRLPELILRSQSVLIPQVDWLVTAAMTIGLNEQATLQLAWVVLLACGVALIAGLFSRVSAVLAWFIHLAAAKSGSLFAYGADHFMTIGLFYLMLAPHPDRRALDARLWRRRRPDAHLLGFFRRVLQLHLCVVYLFSGLSKALGSGWWDGSNLWRALTRPPFDLVSIDALASVSFLLAPAGLAVWIIELLYPALIWRGKTRRLWLGMICAMHATIGLAMGMYLFALIMIVLNLAAFAPPPVTQLDGAAVDSAA